jgi:hypothetical protein
MLRSRLWFAAGVAVATAAALGTTLAEARVEASSEYSKAQTYSAALRYLRVDLGCAVIEKDPDAAYLMFDYHSPGPTKAVSSGSIEIIESGEKVRVIVQLPKLPEYHERVLRDGLMRKLHEEYGAPPRVKPAPEKPSPREDAGTR